MDRRLSRLLWVSSGKKQKLERISNTNRTRAELEQEWDQLGGLELNRNRTGRLGWSSGTEYKQNQQTGLELELELNWPGEAGSQTQTGTVNRTSQGGWNWLSRIEQISDLITEAKTRRMKG